MNIDDDNNKKNTTFEHILNLFHHRQTLKNKSGLKTFYKHTEVHMSLFWEINEHGQ